MGNCTPNYTVENFSAGLRCLSSYHADATVFDGKVTAAPFKDITVTDKNALINLGFRCSEGYITYGHDMPCGEYWVVWGTETPTHITVTTQNTTGDLVYYNEFTYSIDTNVTSAYVLFSSDNFKPQEVKGVAVTLDYLPDAKFFLHRDNDGNWNLFDYVTGDMFVASRSKQKVFEVVTRKILKSNMDYKKFLIDTAMQHRFVNHPDSFPLLVV